MRAILLLLLAFCGVGLAVESPRNVNSEPELPPAPVVAGEWAGVNGLRARLLLGRQRWDEKGALRQGIVFLEIQNQVPAVRNVYFVIAGLRTNDAAVDADQASLQLRVVDRNGVPWQSGHGVDTPGVRPEPAWLRLPAGATMQIPIWIPAMKLPAETAAGIATYDQVFQIPIGADPDNYFVSGTLTIRPPADRAGQPAGGFAWKGELKLPPVKVPIAAPR